MTDTHSKPSQFKYRLKAPLYAFIGFLSASALVAIITLLSGSFGEFELKCFLTTSVIAIASICTLCCSSHQVKRGSAWPGAIGTLLCILSACLLIVGMWAEINSDGYWKSAFILATFGVATAHMLVLLSVDLKQAHAWLKPSAVISILALAMLVAVTIAYMDRHDFETPWKAMLILAIIVSLESLLFPLLQRLGKADNSAQAPKAADSDFLLDPRLGADTTVLTDLPLCRVCLMNDARFAWLILVPRRHGMREIDQLTAADQAALWSEVNRASAALRTCTAVDKINVGALGNIVRQLHVHVVARRENDAAWPGPVWGSGQAQAYAPEQGDALSQRLIEALA